MKLMQPLLLMFLFAHNVGAAHQNCDTPSSKSSSPNRQFINNLDGTVTDSSTKLIWKRCPEGFSLNDNNTAALMNDDMCTAAPGGNPVTYTWLDALQRAKYVNTNDGYANATSWRVPNIKELLSIVETQCGAPALNGSLFPDITPTDPFFNTWSSTPSTYFAGISAATNAWGMFQTGRQFTIKKDNLQYVRLVHSMN